MSATVVAGKKLNIASTTSKELTTDFITIKGGTATLYNGKTSAADMITNTEGIKLNGSKASYMKITLEKPLAKGDVITATSSSSLFLTKDATRKENIDLNSNPYTIPEGSDLIGAKEFYLWNGKFTAIKITRANTQVALTAFFSPATISATEGDVIYDFTGSIGTTTAGTSCTTDNNVITFSSNFSAKEGKYITITPKTDSFKAGDVITLEGYCDSKNLSGVIIYSDVNGSSIFKSNVLAKSADDGSKFTYTIEKDCDALYLGRYGGGTTRLTSLKVERSASSSNKTRLTASFKPNADVVVNTTKTVTLPTLTVNQYNSL